MNSISGYCRNYCPSAFFYVWAVWLRGMTIFYFNSLMFVILCTQILPVSSQLPLGQVPQTIRECTYLSAVLVLCQGSKEHDESNGRWEPRACSGICMCGQANPVVSFSKERIHFNVTLVNAQYRNEIKYNIGNAKRVPRIWESIWFLWSPNLAQCVVSESIYFVWNSCSTIL